MTPDQQDELRRFYAYRQVGHVRDVLIAQLRAAQHDLEGANYKYNVFQTIQNKRRVELAFARLTRIRAQIREVDAIWRPKTND